MRKRKKKRAFSGGYLMPSTATIPTVQLRMMLPHVTSTKLQRSLMSVQREFSDTCRCAGISLSNTDNNSSSSHGGIDSRYIWLLGCGDLIGVTTLCLNRCTNLAIVPSSVL